MISAALPYVSWQATTHWHNVDSEVLGGSIDDVCFNYTLLPSGIQASQGAADDCAVDKLVQLAAAFG